MKKEYCWKASIFSGVYETMDADKVGKEIEALGDNVTTDEIVEKAKSTRSAMHNYFEWDDSVAGHMYRKQQASRLLCNLEVKYIADKKEPVTVRAYVNLKKQSSYQPIETVVSDIDRYQMLLSKAYEDLKRVKTKYQDLEEIQEKLSFLDELN